MSKDQVITSPLPPRSSNGKGSAPRNCNSKEFLSNYQEINWHRPPPSPSRKPIFPPMTEAIVAQTRRNNRGSIKKKPDDWCAIKGVIIMDPDGWRDTGADYNKPITEAEFNERMLRSTVRIEP